MVSKSENIEFWGVSTERRQCRQDGFAREDLKIRTRGRAVMVEIVLTFLLFHLADQEYSEES